MRVTGLPHHHPRFAPDGIGHGLAWMLADSIGQRRLRGQKPLGKKSALAVRREIPPSKAWKA
ncbi:MAG: hypothetical protein WA112_12270 [Rugosibacter sp.]|jgi:hypothetical protein